MHCRHSCELRVCPAWGGPLEPHAGVRYARGGVSAWRGVAWRGEERVTSQEPSTLCLPAEAARGCPGRSATTTTMQLQRATAPGIAQVVNAQRSAANEGSYEVKGSRQSLAEVEQVRRRVPPIVSQPCHQARLVLGHAGHLRYIYQGLGRRIHLAGVLPGLQVHVTG